MVALIKQKNSLKIIGMNVAENFHETNETSYQELVTTWIISDIRKRGLCVVVDLGVFQVL